MNGEYQRLTEILAAAVALSDPQQRSAYLDEACGGDAGLRAKVERLLQAYQEAGDFLEHPADPTIDEASGEGPGTVIGRYKLLEQIGEGAFGRVFMAEQVESVRRKVALKVIKPGMDSREVVARFEAERQALALMDHPNIAHVYDAGTTEMGRPYFVMELVPGLPVTRFCDEHDLSTAERLQLFLQVCHAVQHAHQKAVIHRDLKPTNILVTELDGEPVPKVIDFGVAKALGQQLTEKTLFTAFQQMVGTPAYMSPEQTALSSADVDTRSDVYSLGVLLYELLTGATPLDTATLHRAGFEEMRRLIRETEPPKPSTRLRSLGAQLAVVARHRHTEPSTLARLVHGDLDWIAMKALEKDRARRYQTIPALAEDIERHLTSKPVTAGPPGVLYRTSKFVRRHKFAAALTATAVAAVLLSVAALAYGLVKARQESERADAEAQKAKTEAAVSAAVNTFLLDDLLGQASPESEPDRDVKLRTLVDRAAEKAGERFADQPLVELKVRLTLFSVYLDLGELENARRELERTKEICRQQRLASEDPRWLNVRYSEGILLLAEGRPAEAKEIYEEILPIRRRVLGPEHPFTLRTAFGLAYAFEKLGKPAEAQKLYEELVPITRRVLGAEVSETLRAMQNLANIYRAQGKSAQARETLEELLRIRREALGSEHPDTLGAINDLAVAHSAQGRHADAQKLYEEILPIARRVQGREHPVTLLAMRNVAASRSILGKPGEAQKNYEEVLSVQRRVLGSDHPDTLRTKFYLAHNYSILGKPLQALEIYEEVLPVQRRVQGSEHPDTLETMHYLARTYSAQGKLEEAQKLYEEILPIRRKVLGAEHLETLGTMNNLGDIYAKRGKQVEALKLFEEALPIWRSVLGPEHPDTLRATLNLAATCSNQGKSAEAQKFCEEALPIMRRVLGPEHPDTLETMAVQSTAHLKQGMPAEAQRLLEEILPIRRRVLGPEHRHTLMTMHNLACAYSRQGKPTEAQQLFEELLPIQQRVQGPKHPDTLETIRELKSIRQQLESEDTKRGSSTNPSP